MCLICLGCLCANLLPGIYGGAGSHKPSGHLSIAVDLTPRTNIAVSFHSPIPGHTLPGMSSFPTLAGAKGLWWYIAVLFLCVHCSGVYQTRSSWWSRWEQLIEPFLRNLGAWEWVELGTKSSRIWIVWSLNNFWLWEREEKKHSPNLKFGPILLASLCSSVWPGAFGIVSAETCSPSVWWLLFTPRASASVTWECSFRCLLMILGGGFPGKDAHIEMTLVKYTS